MILHIKAIEADNVPKMDIIGESDPYIIFTMSTSSQKWETKYIANTSKPVWNEQFAIPVTTDADDILTVTLCDYDTPSKSDIISTINIPISHFIENKIVDNWFNLMPVKGVKLGGKVKLAFHYAQPGVAPFVDIYQDNQRETEPEPEPESEPEPEPEPESESESEPEPEPEPFTEEVEPVQKDGEN